MTKVQKADPGLPSRSDSFLRMLELEKRYKMQRIHGHAPATITSPSTSSPSAQPNTPFKARRASGHPPLSHQTQIMKAVRRSSALPSLSISIPPSPTDGPAVETDGRPGELPSKKEERTKTVTFSDPEDNGDSSDQSSICQSPSWEQYGRKKKKKPKKQDASQGEKGEDKPANTLKKKGNRLSKVPPPNIQGVESLKTADRSQSAPELDLYLKSNTAKLDTPNPASLGAMANPKADGKPKGRGFLSSFKLQHGNVAAVQKIIDGQRVIGDERLQAGPPMLQPHAAVIEPNYTNPRKPPSIRSAVSNSTRSISSLDQLPQSARHSSNSSHGRSQSLLSSTLNKLKGPSYLYYRPGEVADGAQSQRPTSSHDQEVSSHWMNEQSTRRPVERPIEDKPERPKERPIVSNEPQQLPDFTFPSKPRRATTQNAPEVVLRNVRDQARPEEVKDLSSEYGPQEPPSFRNRRAQAAHPHRPDRDPTLERERQPRPERASRAPRQPVEVPRNNEYQQPQPPPRQPSRDIEQQRPVGRQINGYVQPRVESWVEPYESEPTPKQQDPVKVSNERIDRAEVFVNKDEDDDVVSVGTHASTIRPMSRRQGHGSPGTDGRKHVTFPSSPNTIGRAVTADPTDEGEDAGATVIEFPQQEPPVEMENPTPTTKPLRLDRSADYFSFISQSYAPPALELRSPMEGKFPSPRIDEEPEDEDGLEHILRRIPVRRDGQEVALPLENTYQAYASSSFVGTRASRQKLPKDSPSLSYHYSDSDIPAFERLGLSPKAARILAGVETSSTSTSQSNTDPSRTSSERSSSSTCDDTPPSPVTVATPDSTSSQSRKLGLQPNGSTGSTTARQSIDDDERTPRMAYQPPVTEPPAKHKSRPAGRDVQDDSWSRTALPIDLETHPGTSSENLNGLTSSPSLIATPSSVAFAEDVNESLTEEDLIKRNPYEQTVAPRAQSALDVHSTRFLPDLKHQPLYQRKAKGGISSISLPNTPPSDLVEAAPRKSALRSRKDSSNSDESSALISPGAAYLQEARKTAPAPPMSSSRALRPHYAHKNSSNSVKTVNSENKSEPLAKVLVECCNCKFFHDMPSRVYQCMAKPESLVEDKLLGVSATITTMVKCPWCAHGMTTQCCSGYAAVVHLKEKLHGK
ncbi:hypothetical protein M426DRAFT_22210 [Hypoxylon sp. CI-4A]|nr:hypothetical protein M426DRAFT_22210 [Hypoxylon sp. CI-4A]